MKIDTIIVTAARKNKYGYVGHIAVMDGKGHILWKETAGITRPIREDALDDAENLKRDRKATWIE